MDFLDRVLPVYVDYLGSFESETGHTEDAHDVMKHLLDYGVQKDKFIPNAELAFTQDQMVLTDPNQRRIVERFPLDKITNPLAFISHAGELGSGFSRVAIFTEQFAGHFKQNPIFHAFQCLDSDPSELVESLTKFTPHSGAGRPFLQKLASKNSLDSNWATSDPLRSQPFESHPPNHNSGVPVPLVTPDMGQMVGHARPQFLYQTCTDPVERKTILLNACIEDIEKFSSEVKAMNAFREDVRQGQHQWSKLEDFRAIDFVKIFQKFKLAFNLLADLDGHLEGTDAPTLVHHLFPPLTLLVDKCYEDYSNDLIRDVSSPSLTRRASAFLSRVLFERELVIWRALGDNWHKAGLPETIPYKPIFQDGWCPGVIQFTDDELEGNSHSFVKGHSKKSSLGSNISGPDDGYDDGFERTRMVVGGSHDDYRDALMARNGKIALVIFSRERQNKRELSVTKGEYLEVLSDDRKWWHCKNDQGAKGYVPHTLLKALIYTETFDHPEVDRQPSHGRRRRTRSVSSSSEERFVPPPVAPPPPQVFQEVVKRPPKGEPIAGLPTTIRTLPQLLCCFSVDVSVTNSLPPNPPRGMSMQEELRSVLDVFSEAKDNNIHLEVNKTPDIFISQDSTPHEVREWIRQKQFSDRVLTQLSGFNGTKILGLSKKDLIASFGREEGPRLHSQLTLSKNTKGYKTARSSELRAVLERARRKTENETHTVEDEEDDNEDHIIGGFYSKA